MSDKTINDTLAEGTGQESSDHEPINKYDKSAGTYQEPAGQLAPPTARPTTNDKAPFGSLKKGG